MKHIKTIIGILLILAALAAMYYWNYSGREQAAKLEEKETQIAEEILPIEKPIRERAFERKSSFFPIYNSWIYAKSGLLNVGDFISIYFKDTKEKIGYYEVAYISENSIDIICKLDDFYKINELIQEYEDPRQLIFVMERANV